MTRRKRDNEWLREAYFQVRASPSQKVRFVERPIWAEPLPMCVSAKVGAIEGFGPRNPPERCGLRADSAPMTVSPL